jgi:hypothetical protein
MGGRDGPDIDAVDLDALDGSTFPPAAEADQLLAPGRNTSRALSAISAVSIAN